MKKLRSSTRRSVQRVMPALVALYLCSCGGASIQNSLHPGGPQTERLSNLWWLMFWVCTAVYVSVMIAVFFALKKRTNESQLMSSPILTPPIENELKRRNVVISSVIITVVILFVLLLVSFSVGRSLTAELAHKNAITVEITGHQWWWEVRYQDPSASNIFTTANEIHIPVGMPVTFQLRGGDVIHSFWVPNLMGKKDLIPGKIATVWLQADQPGVYRGQCAEYCGLQHAHMALWIVAEPEEQFNAWRQNQVQTSVAPATDTQRLGQQVFLSSACVMCHAINGTSAGANFGPNLTHVASRHTIAAATLPNTREHLTQWIVDSQKIKPGNKMPQNNLSSENLNALLDYVQSLK
jgi:cytochrome c oxidase subunit 2